jgi:hypothetical protein
MLMRTLRLSLMLVVVFLLTGDRIGAQDVVPAQTKEDLKLEYDVSVHDLGDGQVAVTFTLADEGRLKPLYAVELNIPGQEKDEHGSPADLAVSLDMRKNADGARAARFELRKDLAERAAIWLTTMSFDGRRLVSTRYHHVIPVANYMMNPPAAADVEEAQWRRMFEVMYDLPRTPKDTQLERLKSLIDEGADVNAAIGFDRMLRVGETRADLRGTTWPLDVAVQRAQVEIVKLLLAKGAKLHGGELAQAAMAGNKDQSLEMVTALLEAGADVNSRDDSFHSTALLWASYKGNKDAVKLLLAQPGIKLDEKSIDGDTALMAAAGNGHAEIVELLLKAGANVSIANDAGETAMTRAQATLANQQAIISMLQSPPR